MKISDLYKRKHVACAIGFISGLLLLSCTSDFSNINSPNTPTEEEGKGDFFYIGVHFRSLQNSVILAAQNPYQFNENLTGQPYARYLTITKDNWNTENFCVFNAPRNWLNSLFNDQIINVYSPWFKLRTTLESEGKLNHYAWAWAELLRVAAVHRTTDMYGPIPYSAIKKNTGSIYVPYDTQKDVYEELFKDLNNAIEILTRYLNAGGANEVSSFKEYDMVYDGNFTKWVRFANSLKLRMAMRMAFADEVNAKKYALEALNHPIGVMTTNDDNAWLKVGVNPLYIMYGPYADTKACAEIMTYLTGYRDPRKEAYFSPVGNNTNVYKGMRTGIKIESHKWAIDNFSNPKVLGTDPLLWMSASEIAFLKAEAKAYWHWEIPENAESLYRRGVELSFEQWKVDGAHKYLENDTSRQASYSDDPNYPSARVSAITIKWDESADEEIKLERIITQKWLALWPLGQEAWAEHRRTGYPRFFQIPVIHNTDNTLKQRGASRIPYGPDETISNMSNYQDAINNKGLGGRDEYGVRLWWDAKKPKAGWD